MSKFNEAIAKAKEEGHDLVDDPPMAASVERQTCTQCGRAVLGNDRVAYGSVLESPCPNKKGAVLGNA